MTGTGPPPGEMEVFGNQIEGVGAQYWECAQCHRTTRLKIVKMLRFVYVNFTIKKPILALAGVVQWTEC